MGGVDYRYELRRGDEVVATGHLSREEPLEVGDRLEIGGQVGIVRRIEPLMGEQEQRLSYSARATHLGVLYKSIWTNIRNSFARKCAADNISLPRGVLAFLG